MRIKKIYSSIGTKFGLLIFFALVVSIVAITSNAVFMFRESNLKMVLTLIDSESSSITETISSIANRITEKNVAVSTFLERTENKIKAKKQASHFLKDDKKICLMDYYENIPEGFKHSLRLEVNSCSLGRGVLPAPKQLKKILSSKYNLKKMAMGKQKILHIPLKEGKQGVIAFVSPWYETHKQRIKSKGLSVMLVSQDVFNPLNQRDKMYSVFIINDLRQILFQSEDQIARGFIKDLDFITSANRGIQFYDHNNEEMIYSFRKIHSNLIGITQMSKSVALEASRQLIYRSTLIAGLILSVVLLFTYLYTKSIVSPLIRLTRAAKKIGQGEFLTDISVKTTDEIGLLSDTMQKMGNEIHTLMESQIHKARMEHELKTARHVQQTLFPPNETFFPFMALSAFFQPASECGGDWWWFYPVDENRLVMLIGDVTGHGASSALITAVAKGAISIVGTIAKLNPNLSIKPSQVLNLLNEIIYDSTKGSILMTFFIAEIDKSKGMITYANASHLSPYLIRSNDGSLQNIKKSNIETFMEQNGPRLGERSGAVYKDANKKISHNDTLLMYTDGIVEATNPEGKMYTTGKFIRTLLKYVANDPISMRDKIIKSATDFIGSQPIDDDLTLVIGRYHD